MKFCPYHGSGAFQSGAGLQTEPGDTEAIPLPARIVLVADALDALTSTRPYRAARPMLGALAEIREHSGTQFCPRCVTALERILPLESLESENDRARLAAVAS